MNAKHPKTRPAPLREQITAFLTRKTEATAKDITKHTTEANFPSRVLNELNKMRTDALVECEKRKGKGNEYWYWLSRAAHLDTHPNSGAWDDCDCAGSENAPSTSPLEAVAVQKPAPAQAPTPAAAPVAEDDSAAANMRKTPGQITEICDKAGTDPALVLAARVEQMLSQRNRAEAAHESLRATHQAGEKKRLETTGELTRALKELDAIRDLLAPFSGGIDPSGMTEVELAAAAATALVNLRRTAENAAEPAVDVLDAARAYVVRVPKRRPRVIGKPETAREAALAAVRNGAARADVFALVEVGTAKRGAEWRNGQ